MLFHYWARRVVIRKDVNRGYGFEDERINEVAPAQTLVNRNQNREKRQGELLVLSISFVALGAYGAELYGSMARTSLERKHGEPTVDGSEEWTHAALMIRPWRWAGAGREEESKDLS